MKTRFQFAIAAAVAVVLFVIVSSGHAGENDEEGWITLFNGKDLTGWKIGGPEECFEVEDGVIVVNGPPSHLFTEQEFSDFDFKAEVMTKPGSNSGIYFHTKYQESGFPSKGYETQVNVTHTDPVKTGSLYNIVKIFETPACDCQWWTQEISVRGRRMTVKINNQVIYEYVEPENVDRNLRPAEGSFALQAHDPNSVVYFRNIRVKPVAKKK